MQAQRESGKRSILCRAALRLWVRSPRYVQAPDAEQAVNEAIAKYEISNPNEQARLAAQRVKEFS
jgi:hypothetical protein